MKNAFVTGNDGFVGAHLTKNLIERGYSVIGLYHDEKPTNTLKGLGLDDKVIKIQGDVCNTQLMRRILTQYKINRVFHLAAQAIVSVALKDPITTYHVNCVGTASLLNACRDLNLDSILVSSTDKVYGEGLDRKEFDILDGRGIYESSKICEDYIARSFFHVYQLPIIVTRACNIYGEEDNNSRIIPNTIKDLKAGKSPIIFKEEKSNPSLREYIYVDDVCDAMIKLSESIEKTKGKTFNIGSGSIATQEEVVMKIINIANQKNQPKTTEPVYKDKSSSIFEIHRQTINSNLVRDVLKWTPKYDLDKGLRRTWDMWKL